MQVYGILILGLLISYPIVDSYHYSYTRGYVFLRLQDQLLTSSFECFFATFSTITNTSWLPLLDIGLACNETDVMSSLAGKTSGGFIALAMRGSCTFTDKTELAIRNNAKGLVIYNTDVTDAPFIMGSNSGFESTIPVVSVSGNSGRAILAYISKVTSASIDFSEGDNKYDGYPYNQISITIFIILTSVVLVVVLLALLLTIYQLSCRCFTLWKRKQKEKEDGRIVKKKLQEINCNRYVVGETTSIDGFHDSCSVCLEDFQMGDMIRTLPCTHPFHQACVDKWLYKKHKCPLCKFDIIKGEHETCSEIEVPYVLETHRQGQPAPGMVNDNENVPQTDAEIVLNLSGEFLIPPASREDQQPV